MLAVPLCSKRFAGLVSAAAEAAPCWTELVLSRYSGSRSPNTVQAGETGWETADGCLSPSTTTSFWFSEDDEERNPWGCGCHFKSSDVQPSKPGGCRLPPIKTGTVVVAMSKQTVTSCRLGCVSSQLGCAAVRLDIRGGLQTLAAIWATWWSSNCGCPHMCH